MRRRCQLWDTFPDCHTSELPLREHIKQAGYGRYYPTNASYKELQSDEADRLVLHLPGRTSRGPEVLLQVDSKQEIPNRTLPPHKCSAVRQNCQTCQANLDLWSP